MLGNQSCNSPESPEIWSVYGFLVVPSKQVLATNWQRTFRSQFIAVTKIKLAKTWNVKLKASLYPVAEELQSLYIQVI